MVSTGLSRPAMTLGPRRATRPTVPPSAAPRLDRLSFSGMVLTFCAVLIAASASRDLRITAGTLLIHPVNLALLPLGLAIGRIRELGTQVLLGLASIAGFFALAAALEPGGLEPTAKVLASAATVIIAASAVRTERDFRFAGAGLALAAALIGVRGLAGDQLQALGGTNPLAGVSNKNGYSVYALPGILLAVHLVMSPSASKRSRLFLIPIIIGIVFALLSTANRSGWLGVLVIAAMYGFRALRSRRNLLTLGAVLLVSAYIGVSYGNRDMINRRIKQTQEGQSSDTMRKDLILAAAGIALEHPILGVSPQQLPFELGRRVPLKARALDSHNVVSLLAAGGGLALTLPFLLFALWLWRRPDSLRGESVESAKREAHFLIRAMLVSWIVRGMFTAEVLYSPAFSMGLGLCIGLGRMRGLWAPALRRVPKRVTRIVPRIVRPGTLAASQTTVSHDAPMRSVEVRGNLEPAGGRP